MTRYLEGSEVLEQLSEVGLLEDFYEAADDDDAEAIRRLLKLIDADEATVARILLEVAGEEES